MAVTKIHDIYLYTSDVHNAVECHELTAWMDHSGIPYTHLTYNDVNQLPEVVKALNTWWNGKELGVWPFVVFQEERDTLPDGVKGANFIEGKEAVISQLPALYALGRG